MSKPISEMILDELQDYALAQTEENEHLREALQEKETDAENMRVLNRRLQERNNELFMKVEQGRNAPELETPAEERETCEDFARKNIKEILRK